MRMRTLALCAAALVLSADAALAGPPVNTNQQIFNDASKTVNRYVFFTIFDDVSASVVGGVTTLSGKVTMPYKKGEIEKRVAKVSRVTRVVNQITVLPVSRWDDDLRYRIARSIYGHSNFWNYAIMANPPIHIVVDRGHVTLTGVVQGEVDRALARSLATQFGVMSVTSDLKTDREVQEQIEKIS